MIRVRSMRFSEELGHQFVALVNRLLPAGSRFELNPIPRLEYVDVTPSIAFPAGSTHVREHIGDAALEINSDAPGGTGAEEVWKRRFRDELRELVRVTDRTATVELVSGDQRTMVGEFRLRTLDVDDLARMPAMMAASALIHELEEQTHRGDHPWEAPAFDSPHAQAMLVERRVTGGERVEDLELRHPPNADVTTVSSSQQWIWWVPFRTRDGGLWANQMEMVGRNVLRARLGRYSDAGSYREAFQAMITNRRLAVTRSSR
ncbi:MAG: hypothetical protein JNK48_18100 [Bryobacterales bacterium]|nr:hypothetical protein [Bryobacterales bacterium]